MVTTVSESCFSSLVMGSTVYSKCENPPIILATAFMLLSMKGNGMGSNCDVGMAFKVDLKSHPDIAIGPHSVALRDGF